MIIIIIADRDGDDDDHGKLYAEWIAVIWFGIKQNAKNEWDLSHWIRCMEKVDRTSAESIESNNFALSMCSCALSKRCIYTFYKNV